MTKKRYSFSFDAPVTILLVFAYIAAYALDISIHSRLPLPEGQSLTSWLLSCSTIDVRAPLDYVRLFAHVLGSDSWIPILRNALVLLILGRSAEEGAGSLPLAVMMLLSALVSGVIACLIPGFSVQGPDPLIFMLLLLNFFISLSGSVISFSWILAFLAFTALRAYAVIVPIVPASPMEMLKPCLPILISLAGGIAGSIPSVFILGKGTGTSRPKTAARPKAKPNKNEKKGRLDISKDETVMAGSDDTFTETLDI